MVGIFQLAFLNYLVCSSSIIKSLPIFILLAQIDRNSRSGRFIVFRNGGKQVSLPSWFIIALELSPSIYQLAQARAAVLCNF